MLKAKQIEYRYESRQVLSVDEFGLEPGTITAVVGANGSGKSTLFRILAFVDRPSSGVLELDGKVISSREERRTARRQVTLIEQQPFLFGGTVRANCAYGLAIRGVPKADARRQAAEILGRMGLAELAGRKSADLSDGERQKVAVARALTLQPRVLLLDEPASAADPPSTNHLYRTLTEEREKGLAIGFSTHQLDDAYRWSDRLVAMVDGRTSQVTPENVFRATLSEGEDPPFARLGNLSIHVVTDRRGPVTIAIPPEDIVVSTEPLHSSVRNQFPGRITRISDDGHGRVGLMVDVGVDLLARITPAALSDLDLSLGSNVFLSVKAVAVRVF